MAAAPSSNTRNPSSFSSKVDKTKRDAMNCNDSASNVAGGGAVNEKKRLFLHKNEYHHHSIDDANNLANRSDTRDNSAYNPTQHLSHLQHSIEGLDRYPNYLSRWPVEDMEQLELALENRLQQVRTQRIEVTQQRQKMKLALQSFLNNNPEWKEFVESPKSWEEIQTHILDPKAAFAIFRSRMFRRTNQETERISVDDVLSGRVPVELDTALLQELMDQEFSDVYSFPLLSHKFCQNLHRFFSAFMNALESSTKSQSLLYGIHKDLDNMGMGWLNDLLFQLIIRPIANRLYKETEMGGGDLDWRQCFIASYSVHPTKSKPRHFLVPHTDDAEVSLLVEFLGLASEGFKFVSYSRSYPLFVVGHVECMPR